MAKVLLARGQVTITSQRDAYTLTQSCGNYIFSAASDGEITSAVSVTTKISVTQGDVPVSSFRIGNIVLPPGFSAVEVDQKDKSITFSIAANTTTLADQGAVDIPVIVAGTTYRLSFVWSKAKAGITGTDIKVLDWVKEWDTGRTQIDANTVITPKLFAGVKNADGTITGTAIGRYVVSAKTDSGTITSEIVDGISVFKDGYKTFCLDNSGNVQLGFGEQFIRYDAITGKVVFGAGVSLLWVGATYIDKDGVFTGKLSATTVATIQIDASQITAGVIDAARLNVDELKASILTAGNIEALELKVTQGKIGGWTIDQNCIYRGTKTDIGLRFTPDIKSMTIGLAGIRGCMWRLDSIGTGSLAGGKIWWDIAGNVVFDKSVSVAWEKGIDTASELARAMAFGKMLFRDPTFTMGMNGIKPYNTSENNNVTATRAANPEAPNDSGQVIEVATTGEASPGLGGFSFHNNSAANKIFITRLIAKIPVGYTLVFNTNSIGTDSSHKFLTSPDGTGEWEEYVIKVKCGSLGSFQPTNYFYLTARESVVLPIVWQLAYATVFDVTSAEKYTTTIDANGIYTGTLTAGQITTGFLAADRIAAGSIKAEKLDAASIKATLINTEYINGLSCTFTQGKIGGWTIGTDNITAGEINGVGATPIQIRTAGWGSGHWYNGMYRPYGITMTWRQYRNAGHFVFGQIAAAADAVKTGFVGIQMMDSESREYFCLSSNTALSGDREVYNSIAGWRFDEAKIWKNSVSLGADGSIVNATKWQFNNDGSGQIASGNIAWDINGNITFGSSVSVSWESEISAAKELAHAMAFGRMLYRVPEFYANGSINYNGTLNYGSNAVRSIEAVAGCPNSTGYVLKYVATAWTSPGDMRVGGFYFGNMSRANAVYVVRLIARIPAGRSIQNYHNQFGTGGVSQWLTSNAGTDKWEEYICKVTCGESGSFSWINYFALTGGVAPTAAVPVIWYIAYATVFDVTSSEKYTTTLDANGIYTGTLTAAQVNAVAISAGSITTGTLSVDRLAAGSIKAEKLDAASLKASVINTDYINGLSCTFVRGKIGGWIIGTSTITGNHLVLDSTNRRIAVFDSASSQASGKRVQLYYNNDADFGVFATDAAGNCVARLGSANLIAGWNVTTNSIWKNSVSLGADGSITNGSKWKLNNDGSGSLASGNISWNASGAVTFSSAVSIQWKNDIEAAKSNRFGYRYYKQIIINGESSKYYPVIFKGGDQTVKRDILIRRGYNEQAPSDWNNGSTTHMGGLSVLIKANFGGWGGTSYSWDIYDMQEVYCRIFGGAVHCGNCCMFAVFLRGGGASGAVYHLYSDQPIESSFLSPSPIPPAPQIAYNSDLIFQQGSSLANAPAPRTLTATVQEEIRRHRFIALAEGSDATLKEHPLTYIGATGIYTGTIRANQVQVDSALVVGGVTYNGSISVRDAGNVVKVTLDRTGIKAVAGTIGGWNLSSSQIYSGSVVLTSGGSITNGSRWKLNADGSGQMANGNFSWDAAGKLTATGGNFKDVTIQGTIRSAFVLNDPSFWIGGSDSSQVDPRHYDNVVVVRGSWNENIHLQWTLDQSGRRICLLNYMWHNTITQGYMDLTAPSGKYFYEDGIQKTTLTFSRELIELIGFGDDLTFWGWIVLNRRDIGTEYKYGSFQQVLAQGTVTCTSTSSATIKYKTFDGKTMSVRKSGQGNFFVYMPWVIAVDKYMVMLTGRTCTVQNTPIYASIRNQYTTYFQVTTQDDSTTNEGSFNFQIISMGDFK